MRDKIEHFREWLGYQNYSWMPGPLWMLIASPLLHWSIGGERWFMWPHGVPKNPLKMRFWYHG